MWSKDLRRKEDVDLKSNVGEGSVTTLFSWFLNTFSFGASSILYLMVSYLAKESVSAIKAAMYFRILESSGAKVGKIGPEKSQQHSCWKSQGEENIREQ